MRISRDPEFAPNFQRERNVPRVPPERLFRPWEDPGPRIPDPYDKLTLEKDMTGQDRLKLLEMKGKTARIKIQMYVRERWPILGSFHDRTKTWDTLCFLKRE